MPSAIGSTNYGAFFGSGDILYSYSTNPTFPYATDTIIAYNTVTNTWSNVTVSGGALNIAGRNAGFTTTNPKTGMGFYLGTGSPGDQHSWNIEGLLVFNGSDPNGLKWTNETADAPIIDAGSMAYIPLSEEGVLIAYGGVDTTATSNEFSNNCCYGTTDMAIIHVYDIASSTWYSVTASGQIPQETRNRVWDKLLDDLEARVPFGMTDRWLWLVGASGSETRRSTGAPVAIHPILQSEFWTRAHILGRPSFSRIWELTRSRNRYIISSVGSKWF